MHAFIASNHRLAKSKNQAMSSTSCDNKFVDAQKRNAEAVE